MSVQIKTPPRHETLPSHTQANSSSKKRRASQHGEGDAGGSFKRRKHAVFKFDPSLKDPLNLTGAVEEEPEPVEPINLLDRRSSASLPVRRDVNISDPLNLTIDDAGNPIGPLSPTCPIRRRKKISKRTLQALEIDFNDSPATTPLQTDSSTVLDLSTRITEQKHETTDSFANISANETKPEPHKQEKVEPVSVKAEPQHQTRPVVLQTQTAGTSTQRKDSDKSTQQVNISPKGNKSFISLAGRSKVTGADKSKINNKNKSKMKSGKTADHRNPFIYGNYNRYYGYRHESKMEFDDRVNICKMSWFKDKECLDIGCNTGQVTSLIAREYHPRRIIGLDLDKSLIKTARRNLQYFKDKTKWPSSLTGIHGPIKAPNINMNQSAASTSNQSQSSNCAQLSYGKFPNNLNYITGDYCLNSDKLLDMVRPEFHTITALSVTKWIHLHNGDVGLKRCFHRMYKQLYPGGMLILEPQMWASYKRNKLPAEMRGVFDEILFKPDQFTEYLLTVVGFSTCERLNVQEHRQKGFRRPLLVFKKAAKSEQKPAPVVPSTRTVQDSNQPEPTHQTSHTQTQSSLPSQPTAAIQTEPNTADLPTEKPAPSDSIQQEFDVKIEPSGSSGQLDTGGVANKLSVEKSKPMQANSSINVKDETKDDEKPQ